MALHRLKFDTTDAGSRGDTHTVGAVLYDQVNDRLGLINASQELLVHDQDVLDQLTTGGVTLDSSHAEDSAHASGHDGQFALAIRVDDLTAVPATALAGTELDYQGLIGDTDGALFTASKTLDGSGSPITSTGTALDVNIASGTIDVDDGLANTAIKQVAETVGVAAAVIVDGADELASRKYLYVFNNSNQDTYIGDSGVSTSNGFPIPPGSTLEARTGDAVDVYMIGDKAAMDVRTLQLS